MSGNIQLKMSKDYSVQFIVEDIQTVKWSIIYEKILNFTH